MNRSELMNWQTFKTTLEQHPELTLQFQYAGNHLVNAAYHLTEIKQAPIVSVDCGGVMNSWTEIILQLWEPEIKDADRAMEVKKALSIISLVEKSLPLNPFGIVKIEYGNTDYDARQLYPGSITVKDDQLIVDLNPAFTECKAIGRGESCGTPVKPAIEIFNTTTDSTTCTPGGGCC